MSVRLLKTGKRWLVLGHRWLGIATGLFFALWIGSGLVMLYVPFPQLTEAERLARLSPIAWERVAVSPDAALSTVASSGPPRAFGLEMRGAEPVYQIVAADGARVAVSADTGERLPPVSADEAARLAGGEPGRASVELVEQDQWTVTARYDPLRPFHKVALADPAGTELYVSRMTGEIALDTARAERGWNWIGAVVHWIYPTPLRARADLWRDVVLWLSGIAAIGATSGLVTGIWRLRARRRYPSGAITPYRGYARWHHLVGLVGGVTLTTFIVSGWLSMNPNHWFSSPSPPADLLAAYTGAFAPLGLDVATLRRAASPNARVLRFTRLGGRWFCVWQTSAGSETRAADGSLGPDVAEIASAARALPDRGLVALERLTAYDDYWYPHHDTRVLPVLRLRFDDPSATWLHIDPSSGEILNRLDRSGRVNRWLFAALHRLDLPVFTTRRPAWDALQWCLNLLAGTITTTGIILGWRRLARTLNRSSD